MEGFDSLKSDNELDSEIDDEKTQQEIHFGYDKAKSYLLSVSK